VSYGIDIGTTALKVVGLRRTFGGWAMTAAARRRTGAAEVPRLLADALGGKNGQRAGVVGLSGRDLNLQVVHQPAMKPLNYRVMMGYELDQRRGESSDLYLDFCTLREPDAFYPQYLALIGIGKSAYVDERIGAAAKASVDVRDAVPNSFALYQAYRNAYEVEGGTVLLIDLGSDNMDLAFVRGGRLIFARNVSSGARVFDNQVAGAVGGSPQAAEAVKIAKANLGPSDADAEDDGIYGAVRSAAGQLTGFITSSINHAKVQLNDRELAVDKVYLSGGGARLRGLPEYLTAALKLPVEILDPFRKIDTKAIEKLGGEEVRSLPTDLAVAIGLAQLVNPPTSTSASTLSILPDGLKKRKSFFREGLWLWGAAAVMGVALVALTGLALWRKAGEKAKLEEFQSKTADVRRRIDEMAATAGEQRDLVARTDYLQSYLGSGRALLDVTSRLKKALPDGMVVRGVRMGGASDGRGVDDEGRQRAAFVVRRRGPVVGEVESESDVNLKLREFGEAFPKADVEGDVLRWPAGVRSLIVAGDVDENIRGKAGEALIVLRDQLSDPSRGMKAVIKSQRPSDREGWRAFEILVTFD
jgi:type IV pilus assembly protein PilM